MKKTLAAMLMLLLYNVSNISMAQPLRNEWIDYSKTYYKFPVASTGLLRITQPQLAALGIAGTNVQHFKLWRNGVEVPLYTSVASGTLGTDGFIEFYGKKNDGVPDTDLYPNPFYQPGTVFSLFSDTASYFLTVSPTTSNARVAGTANNLGSPGTPEPYCWFTAEQHYNAQIWGGYATYVQGEYVRSATYDKGEGYQSNEFDATTFSLTDLQAYAAGPAMKLYAKGAGAFTGGRPVYCKLNSNLVGSTYSSGFDNFELNVASLPVSSLNSGTAELNFYTGGTTIYHKVMLSSVKLTYPRLLNGSGWSRFEFSLPANTGGAYLEISNFNNGGANPVLYDLTTNQRYVGEVSAGVVKVKLAPSTTEHQLVLLSTANTPSVAAITPRTFVNYGTAANQGNYLIISNRLLFTGSNQVQAYSNYRASAAGGGYQTKVIDIEEITDQFAYGIPKHPLSIRNFLRFARASFATAPQFVLLIGHGLDYKDYKNNEVRPNRELLNLVPTWGYPGSDNLLSAGNNTDPYVQTPIGRITVTNNTELQQYLDKVIQFEQLQASGNHDQATQDWRKHVLHIVGSNDATTGNLIIPMMNNYRQVIRDTFPGAEVHTFAKVNDPGVSQSSSEVANLMNKGVSLLTYFGHSSATSLDFNLNNPGDYTNTAGRYPVFIANGCQAGNFFTYDESRLNGQNYTISERFLLAPARGSIAFIASTHFGVVNTLDYITGAWYQATAKWKYGRSLGEIQQKAIDTTWKRYNGDFYTRLTLEETTINGDPAIKIFSRMQPDYSLEPDNIRITPEFVSSADDRFQVQIVPHNLGKTIRKNLTLRIERQLPDGSTRLVTSKLLPGIWHTDTIRVSIPITGNTEKGTNRIIATIDALNETDEVSESNNIAYRDFNISDDEIRPVFPYPLSIVSTPSFKLTGSTVDPLEPARTYRMQMDTTETFNSPLLFADEVSGKGGVIEFTPMSGLQNGKVYYWRIAPVVAGVPVNWRTASFTYHTGDSAGWGQGHLYQHLKSDYQQIRLDSASRNFHFTDRINNLFITHSKYPESGTDDNHFSISVNGDMLIASACVGASVIFNVFDTISFKPWKNLTGLYGSAPACNTTNRSYNFEYTYTTPQSRKRMMDFLDAIPDGYYVSARLILDPVGGSYVQSLADTWKADTLLYGSGKSLYHSLQAQGAQLDNINDPNGRIWALVFQKNSAARFEPKFSYTTSVFDRITSSVDCPTIDTVGLVTSPLFGPAGQWQQVRWQGHSLESSNSADSVSVAVIGVSPTGVESQLYLLNRSQQRFDLSAVSAAAYPYIRLKLRNQDAVKSSPWQLESWYINYIPVPEGGLAPNLYQVGIDSVRVDSVQLSRYPFGFAFKNVSKVGFDSLKVKVALTDTAGNTRTLMLPKIRPLPAGDTAHVYFELDTDTLSGTYNLLVDVNPDNDQKEQYHFNNFVYKAVTVLRTADLGICPGSSTTYQVEAGGSSYQWQVDTGNGYINIGNDAIYSGTGTASLRLTAPPTSWYGYRYRCLVNNSAPAARLFTLTFVSKWNGNQSTDWENTSNWSCGVLPDAYTDVILNSALERYPVVNSEAACRSIRALPNTSLKITSGHSLKVAGKPE